MGCLSRGTILKSWHYGLRFIIGWAFHVKKPLEHKNLVLWEKRAKLGGSGAFLLTQIKMWAQSANIPVSCLWIHTPHAYVWPHLEVNFLTAKTFGSKFVTISTLRTFVSLLSTVSQFMSCQGTRLREGLVTLWTVISLLSTVSHIVSLETSRKQEWLSTLKTVLFLLSAASQFMLHHVTRLPEGLFTLWRVKFLFTTVSQFVSL